MIAMFIITPIPYIKPKIGESIKVSPFPSLINRITSLFKREKEEKAENIENSVTSLQLYEKQPEQLLDKDELEAISNIKFLNSSEETLIEKDDNNSLSYISLSSSIYSSFLFSLLNRLFIKSILNF